MPKSSGEKIISLLQEINSSLEKNLRMHFSDWGLTTPQIIIISVLNKFGDMKISDISNKVSMADSTISGIVDRLEKMEFVERIRSHEDRRIVKVRLTEKSKKMKKDFNLCLENYFSLLLKDVTKTDIENIITGMEKLRNLLKQE